MHLYDTRRIKARNEKIQGAQKKMSEAYKKLFQQKWDDIQNNLTTEENQEILNPNQVAESLVVQLPNPVSKPE